MAVRPRSSRLSGQETLMWRMERDPLLRSSFTSISLLDRAPDEARLRTRLLRAVEAFPRLRQRIVESALPPVSPAWVDDPDFDLGHHLRRLALPAPRSERHLLDLAALQAQDAFDPSRPLWQITVVEGLRPRGAAMLVKLHHAVADGMMALRLSGILVDLERDPPDREACDASAGGTGEDRLGDADVEPYSAFEWLVRRLGLPGDSLQSLGGLLSSAAERAAGVITDPSSIGREAAGAVETARSLARQAIVTGGARSPLWAGKRSGTRRFELLRFDLDRVKLAARALGGTVNDLFVTGVAGGAAAYHRAKGAPVEELRISMPVSTRSADANSANAFTPARVLVPAGIEDPLARFSAVHDRLSAAKAEKALGLADVLAGALSGLPDPILGHVARQQVETVDFAASNVIGSPVDIYLAGALVLANHPMGPTMGTAFNATVMSYGQRLDMGLNVDTGAVSDPALLRRSIARALDDVIEAGAPGDRG